MGLNRYRRAPKLRGGKMVGTYDACYIIFQAASRSMIEVDVRKTSETERLDHIAGEYYGDGRLWWVIAGASGIGWCLQVPPGTYLRIPTSIEQVAQIVG
tara:strand:- start:438 stop:734 length:297 start_codon:yes stop_codon:yes gene_type:complete